MGGGALGRGLLGRAGAYLLLGAACLAVVPESGLAEPQLLAK